MSTPQKTTSDKGPAPGSLRIWSIKDSIKKARDAVNDNQRSKTEDAATFATSGSTKARIEAAQRTQLSEDLKQQAIEAHKIEQTPVVKEALRKELAAEVREELKNEMRGSVRSELETDLADAVLSDLRSELRDTAVSALKEECRAGVEQQLRGELREGLVSEMKKELRQEVVLMLREELAAAAVAAVKKGGVGGGKARAVTEEPAGAVDGGVNGHWETRSADGAGAKRKLEVDQDLLLSHKRLRADKGLIVEVQEASGGEEEELDGEGEEVEYDFEDGEEDEGGDGEVAAEEEEDDDAEDEGEDEEEVDEEEVFDDSYGYEDEDDEDEEFRAAQWVKNEETDDEDHGFGYPHGLEAPPMARGGSGQSASEAIDLVSDDD